MASYGPDKEGKYFKDPKNETDLPGRLTRAARAVGQFIKDYDVEVKPGIALWHQGTDEQPSDLRTKPSGKSNSTK